MTDQPTGLEEGEGVTPGFGDECWADMMDESEDDEATRPPRLIHRATNEVQSASTYPAPNVRQHPSRTNQERGHYNSRGGNRKNHRNNNDSYDGGQQRKRPGSRMGNYRYSDQRTNVRDENQRHPKVHDHKNSVNHDNKTSSVVEKKPPIKLQLRVISALTQTQNVSRNTSIFGEGRPREEKLKDLDSVHHEEEKKTKYNKTHGSTKSKSNDSQNKDKIHTDNPPPPPPPEHTSSTKSPTPSKSTDNKDLSVDKTKIMDTIRDDSSVKPRRETPTDIHTGENPVEVEAPVHASARNLYENGMHPGVYFVDSSRPLAQPPYQMCYVAGGIPAPISGSSPADTLFYMDPIPRHTDAYGVPYPTNIEPEPYSRTASIRLPPMYPSQPILPREGCLVYQQEMYPRFTADAHPPCFSDAVATGSPLPAEIVTMPKRRANYIETRGPTRTSPQQFPPPPQADRVATEVKHGNRNPIDNQDNHAKQSVNIISDESARAGSKNAIGMKSWAAIASHGVKP